MSTDSSQGGNWKSMIKQHPKRGVPEGLWRRCPGCEQTIFRKEAEKRLGVCPECDYHWYVPARDTHRAGARRGDVRGVGRRSAADRSAGLRRQASPIASGSKRSRQQTGLQRRSRGRHRHDPGTSRGLRRDRLGVHHGQHGLGRRRETHPNRRAGHRARNCR